MVEPQREDRVAGLQAREVHGHVRLRAGVRLHVRVLGAEQLLRPVDRELLDLVDDLAAAVVALARVALGVLVRRHAADRLEHARPGEVLGGDQLDAVALPLELAAEQRRRSRGRSSASPAVRSCWSVCCRDRHWPAEHTRAARTTRPLASGRRASCVAARRLAGDPSQSRPHPGLARASENDLGRALAASPRARSKRPTPSSVSGTSSPTQPASSSCSKGAGGTRRRRTRSRPPHGLRPPARRRAARLRPALRVQLSDGASATRTSTCSAGGTGSGERWSEPTLHEPGRARASGLAVSRLR